MKFQRKMNKVDWKLATMGMEDAITSPKQDELFVHLICSLLFLQYKTCLPQPLTKYQHPVHMPVKYLSICSKKKNIHVSIVVNVENYNFQDF
jgi:hypothetical protein